MARKQPVGSDVCVAMRQCLLQPSRRGFLQFAASRLPILVERDEVTKRALLLVIVYENFTELTEKLVKSDYLHCSLPFQGRAAIFPKKGDL